MNILLATTNKRLKDSFKGISASRAIKFNTIEASARLNTIFKKKGRILEVLMLDLTFPEHDLGRLIFYVKQFRKDLPVVLINVDASLIKEKEALRNLSVYAVVKEPATRQEAGEILDDLNDILDLDMDKRLEKVDYLEKERVFACTFKNGSAYFLSRKDIPEDDGSSIKKYVIEKDAYYFTVRLKSGKEYLVLWDFILHICEEKYEFHRSKKIESISSIEIGKRIKEVRDRKALRQVDLAKKTGILRANIARIESGTHKPSLETLERISGALDIPVADLLNKEDYEGWLETLEIMSDKEAMKDIRLAEKELREGKSYAYEEVFEKTNKRGKKRAKKRVNAEKR